MSGGIGNILSKSLTAITKTDSLYPIIGLEAAVVGGRTKKAYERGGKEEARERIIEELMGSIVWIGGVKLFNWIGDKVITKILKNGKNANVDTGSDFLRKPFDNFLNSKDFNPKKFSSKALSRMKLAKVAASVLAANAIIGFIVPPLNHKLTTKLRKKNMQKNEINYQQNSKSHFDAFCENSQNKDKNNGNVQFKGGLNPFINFIENTNTGQLLSTDVGVMAGRGINSRSKPEVIEVLVRDGGSIYFYMFAQQHVTALLNKIESGRFSRLDPNSTNVLHDHLSEMFKDKNDSMSVEEFRNKLFGDKTQNPDLKKFFADGEEIIDLDKFNSIEKNPEIQARAFEMSKLQPQQIGKSVLSKEQVLDVYTKGEMNSPKLLKRAYETFTGGKSSNPNKFVPEESLRKLRGRMSDYVEDICKAAEKSGGKVDMKLLNKLKKSNMCTNGLNFITAFSVAALFLGKIIPMFQYWLTKKTTGVDAFPGTYDYSKNKNVNKK